MQISLILAVVTAGISPACRFISGQQRDLIEICSADGTAKVIEVASHKGSEAPSEHHHNKKDDCAFCFTQTHVAKGHFDSPVLPVPEHETVHVKLDRKIFFLQSPTSQHQPRGPPVLS
ncbi:MAG: DUF2946 domain-containing protein [Alphaproteobacteria bacterium]|nr:DUF2946 domain-containing protein [Alphaproteobacteria bacterium]